MDNNNNSAAIMGYIQIYSDELKNSSVITFEGIFPLVTEKFEEVGKLVDARIDLSMEALFPNGHPCGVELMVMVMVTTDNVVGGRYVDGDYLSTIYVKPTKFDIFDYVS